jgi:hypothetical protein
MSGESPGTFLLTGAESTTGMAPPLARLDRLLDGSLHESRARPTRHRLGANRQHKPERP